MRGRHDEAGLPICRQEPCMDLGNRGCHLEPLAEVERALLVVKVLESPQPKLGSLLVLRGAEHFCSRISC